MPNTENVGDVHEVGATAISRFFDLQVRVTSRLAELATVVETAACLKPLPPVTNE